MTDIGISPTYTDTAGNRRDAHGVFGAVEIKSDSGVAYGSPEWFALGFSPTGAFVVNKFGRNNDVDTSTTPEDVWGGGGVYTGFPTGAAENVQVFSSSASDTGTINVLGLDENYNRVSRSVAMTGTTPVTIPGGTMIRIHSCSYDAGPGSTFNVGVITVRHATTTANVFNVIPIGRSQSADAAYTIPAGHRGLLINCAFSILGATVATADGSFWIREFNKSPRLRRPFTAGHDAPAYDVIFGGIVLDEKTDIIARVITTSVNNIDVTMKYDLLVVPNAP